MAVECYIEHAIGVKCDSRATDALLAEIAGSQHGVVGRAQLLACGVTRQEIGHRLERRRLHPIHAGVYAVGHRVLSREGRWMAAVLAGGPGAVLSHRAAGALWGVLLSARRPEVTVPRSRRSRPTTQFHRARLPADEMTVHDGIPVTSVPRTVFDLAAVCDGWRTERAINEAEARQLTDPLSLAGLVERHPHSRGVGKIRRILADANLGLALTRSEMEDDFRSFVEGAGLPRPEVNATLWLGGREFEVDCLWRVPQLAVEVDSRRFHSSRAAFEADRERDRRLAVAGWRVVRITWRQLHEQPQRLAADLAALIG